MFLYLGRRGEKTVISLAGPCFFTGEEGGEDSDLSLPPQVKKHDPAKQITVFSPTLKLKINRRLVSSFVLSIA